MQNKRCIAALVTLLAVNTPTQAGTGLLLNDDSVQIHHMSEGEPGPLFGIEAIEDVPVHEAYNFLYSQEPHPRNYLFSAEIEFPEETWEIQEKQSLTPRVDLIFTQFMNYYTTAIAVGASHRLTFGETSGYTIQSEITIAPPLTVFGKGKYLWTFKTQLNYPITDTVECNLGYRSITMKLLNNYEDGFERGIYFGLTTRFE